MASYTVSVSGSDVTFNVTGIASGNLVEILIRLAADTSDVTVNEKLTATSSTFSKTYTLDPEEYACNVKVNDGDWLGKQTFTIEDNSGPTRPSDWSWSGIIYSGCPLENLTASHWNDFEDRINAFREYAGLSAYGFTRAVSGVTLLSTLFSEAESAIGTIPGHGTVPMSRALSMTYFDGLADALNAV